ncbi:MAG: hypothetical protein ABSC06_30625 [Rhodopila sp.]|jgi:hypothetical protein
MPRFVARPIGITAVQWTGHTHMLPEAFRLAVCRHLVGGMIEIRTADGPRACKHEDWIVHGPDGTFSVVRGALFETWFEALQPTPIVTDPEPPAIIVTDPEPPAIPAKRQPRKETVHG